MKLIMTVLCMLLPNYVLPQTDCSIADIILTNTTYGDYNTWLNEYGYEGYLEMCTSNGPNQPSEWKRVCGGEDWTNREAMVACNQLGYPNTTAIAITGGLCSTPPATMSNAVAVDRCSGTEITLGECQSSITYCNKWGGVICTSFAYCPQEICHNTSYCHPSPTCSNCTLPPELNCICYAECDPPCSNGGSCSYNNICQCSPNWTGPHCENLMTSKNSVTTEEHFIPHPCTKDCQNGGKCSADGNCKCTENWTGSSCKEAVCPLEFCLNGGNCLHPTTPCTCLMSYTGSRCEGPNTTILYASIVAAVLFGLLVVLISAVLIFKCRQLRRKKVNNTSSTHEEADEEMYLPMASITEPSTPHELSPMKQKVDNTYYGEHQTQNLMASTVPTTEEEQDKYRKRACTTETVLEDEFVYHSYHTKSQVPSYIESVTLENVYDEPGHEGYGQDTSIPQDEHIYASCDMNARALDIATNQPLPTQYENTLNRCVPKTTEEHVYYDLTHGAQLTGSFKHNCTTIEFDNAIYSAPFNQ